MASLTVIKGPDRGKRFELADAVPTLGRDAKNSIRLHDSEISRMHAELRRTDRGFILRDLRSSNGTFVNGQQIEYQGLQTGDRLRLGQTELIFTGDATTATEAGDLAGKISLLTSEALADSSAIVHRIKQSEGSAFLQHPERAGSQWLQEALSNLSVMYETSRAVSHITDITQLVDHLLKLVFETIQADRGCVMLKNADTGLLEPVAVRFREEDPGEETIAISRTITDWVLRRNEGVIIIDAAEDSRFRESQSVLRLGIREAICVPLAGRHDTLGVMYVDVKCDGRNVLKTQQPNKLAEEQLKLLIAIAHQAGLAIEDTRFYQGMVQAERLAAIGQTIATVSHHIKNIMQGLRSGSYLIDLGFQQRNFELLGQGWSVCQKNQTKIYNLVMDMLTFSKEREPSLEMSDVNRLVREIADLMRPRAADFSATLELRLDPKMPLVAIDADAIHRALLNIVTNAIDAVEGMPEAHVTIETSRDASGRYLLLTVADNGIGIPDDQQTRIFQIFHSTKGTKGTGLGLAVSQKIAREHGGDIRVVSRLGQGSRFIIELPIRRVDTLEHDPGLTTRLDMEVHPASSPPGPSGPSTPAPSMDAPGSAGPAGPRGPHANPSQQGES